MQAVIVGPDRGLGSALETHDITVRRVDGVGTGRSLTAAGIDDADLLVVTDIEEATAVPIAKDRNPGLRVLVYALESLPEFVSKQVDLAVDPDLLDPAVVAEEIVGVEA